GEREDRTQQHQGGGDGVEHGGHRRSRTRNRGTELEPMKPSRASATRAASTPESWLNAAQAPSADRHTEATISSATSRSRVLGPRRSRYTHSAAAATRKAPATMKVTVIVLLCCADGHGARRRSGRRP